MTTQPKTGPLTRAELQGIWESATDPSYWRPLEVAGEGNGFEAYTQAWVGLERVSQAIDRTTQAMFILPWSGQSDAPAGGGQKAQVTLQLTRTLRVDQPLILQAGTLVGEVQTDWGANPGDEGQQVVTGRRYALDLDVTFEPGQQGPLTVTATAERVGYGYNNPLVGTLTLISQPGTQFTNIDATIVGSNYPSAFVGPSFVQSVYLVALDEADAFLPDHVGQYVILSSGANAGRIGRMVGWQPPDLSQTPPTGGTVQLELSQSIQSFAGDLAGTFQVGEQLELFSGLAPTGFGRLTDAQTIGGNLYLTFSRTCGHAVTRVIGLVSGASATIDVIHAQADFVPEGMVETWTVLDWVTDWGVGVTNLDQPAGGMSPMLDELGRERNIDRSPGESDDSYRTRVSELADTVSPNAIRRALNRTIPTIPWCFREVGQTSWPGFYYDHDAYDLDLTTFAGVTTGTFAEGEKCHQVNGGAYTYGRACLDYQLGATVPGPPGALLFRGVSNVIGPGFAGGFSLLIGELSGAKVSVTAVTGGLRPADRFRLVTDYYHMRATFYVGLPPPSAGDDGFAYDDHPFGAYDATPFADFYDGAAWADGSTYRNVWNAIEKVRAGGVVWEIYQETGPCP